MLPYQPSVIRATTSTTRLRPCSTPPRPRPLRPARSTLARPAVTATRPSPRITTTARSRGIGCAAPPDTAATRAHPWTSRCSTTERTRPNGKRQPNLRVRLYWRESDIASRWLHREFNLMFTLNNDKDQRIILLSLSVNESLRCIHIDRNANQQRNRFKRM